MGHHQNITVCGDAEGSQINFHTSPLKTEVIISILTNDAVKVRLQLELIVHRNLHFSSKIKLWQDISLRSPRKTAFNPRPGTVSLLNPNHTASLAILSHSSSPRTRDLQQKSSPRQKGCHVHLSKPTADTQWSYNTKLPELHPKGPATWLRRERFSSNFLTYGKRVRFY